MSWTAVKEAIGKDPNLRVILPIGSVEQHGPHLPLSTDSVIAEHIATRVASQVPCIIFPTLQIGYSLEHVGFPGTVSTPVWAALVLNHALLTSHKRNLIPVTPNDVFHELLQCKLRRITNLMQSQELAKRHSQRAEYKTGFSAFSLAACVLPNLELESFEDVLVLRERLKDELIAFRYEMSRLAERIEAQPCDEDFPREIEYVVKHHIEPAVYDLERKLKTDFQELATETLSKSAQKVLPVMASILAPPLLVMSVAAGLTSIETALAHHVEQKKTLKANGLSLLIKLR
jgi:hypothetical protein